MRRYGLVMPSYLVSKSTLLNNRMFLIPAFVVSPPSVYDCMIASYFDFFFFRYNRLRDKFPAASFSGRPNLSEAGFDLLNKLLTYDPAKVKLILFNGTRDYTNLALSIFYASLSFILLTKDT